MKNKLQSLVIIILLLALGVLGGMYYSEIKDKDKTIANNNIATENNITNQVLENKVKNEATNTNKEEEKTNIEMKLVNKITASGFAGASMHNVELYSNGEAYVVTYNGAGEEEKDVISRKLIAKNVKAIKQSEDKRTYGGIVIIGGEKLECNYGWIIFE